MKTRSENSVVIRSRHLFDYTHPDNERAVVEIYKETCSKVALDKTQDRLVTTGDKYVEFRVTAKEGKVWKQVGVCEYRSQAVAVAKDLANIILNQ